MTALSGETRQPQAALAPHRAAEPRLCLHAESPRCGGWPRREARLPTIPRGPQKPLAFENPGEGVSWGRQEPSYGFGTLPSL